MNLLVSLLLQSAAAQEVPEAAPVAEPADHEAYVSADRSSGSKKSGSKSGSKKSGSKKKSSDDDEGLSLGDGKIFKPFKVGKVKVTPYVSPGAGVVVTSTGTAPTASLGGGAGFKYQYKKKYRGDLHLDYNQLVGTSTDSLSGRDLHLGNDFTYREKTWGLTVGGAYFFNEYYQGDTVVQAPSGGLELPIRVDIGKRKLYGYGGVTPAMVFNEARNKGTNTVPGGFDEMTWVVGAGGKVSGLRVEVGYQSRVTPQGTFNTPIFTVGAGGR